MSDLFVNAILGVSLDGAGEGDAGDLQTDDVHMDEGTDMFEVAANVVIPPVVAPLPEPLPLKPVEEKPAPPMHDHEPGHFCSFCWCDDCRRFFGTGKPTQLVNPRPREIPLRPRYSYMHFVNSMRAASARREEERQKRRQAEHDQANGDKSPKKPKPTKTPKKKNVRHTPKRRRQ